MDKKTAKKTAAIVGGVVVTGIVFTGVGALFGRAAVFKGAIRGVGMPATVALGSVGLSAATLGATLSTVIHKTINNKSDTQPPKEENV